MRDLDEPKRHIEQKTARSGRGNPFAAWFRSLFSAAGPAPEDHVPSLNLTREALARAERESAMKSRILATVSHDIRTPLSGIAGMSHLLGQTRLTPEQANYLSASASPSRPFRNWSTISSISPRSRLDASNSTRATTIFVS